LTSFYFATLGFQTNQSNDKGTWFQFERSYCSTTGHKVWWLRKEWSSCCLRFKHGLRFNRPQSSQGCSRFG
jgi:hypothetical protein